ncbi:probable F-box protein At4g22030 [Euphorbia lathyris]|uniref:probable F-box protein At4g22030 n=1 Tax=Euphorbia lathyris TaxID=212925 RepID=UPI00331324B3
MSSLQTSSLLFPSTTLKSAISVPKIPSIRLPIIPKPQNSSNLVDKLKFNHGNRRTLPQKNEIFINPKSPNSNQTLQLYAILEAVAERIEMHQNVAVQRDNWNKLLLNSTNMIILSATTMAGVASTSTGDSSHLALNLSSTLLFTAATGMLLIINKIQPSQLAEEQRNATRLFKQLYKRIETTLATLDHNNRSAVSVNAIMEKVFALDKAFPLPLLGKMIDKFPSKFEAPIWWTKSETRREGNGNGNGNGWNEELESELREIARVIRGKDSEDYMKLGNIALKVNKILAVSGPLLTGIAAVGSVFAGNGSWGGIVAATMGALACTVNTLEHGGQVGMVVEMYRNCAGFFELMEETIESTLEESDVERRENGEMFEMNLSLQLGSSLSELRNLARKSSVARRNGSEVDEFASKLF